MLHQNTRPRYDELSTKNRNLITQKPLRYMTVPLTENRTLIESHPERIDVANDMRMKPTRLNHYNRPETELYGTAPNQSLGHRQVVDIESMLRNGEQFQECNKMITEETFVNGDFIDDPLTVDTNFRPASTRVQLRNEYCKIGSRSLNSNTHINK